MSIVKLLREKTEPMNVAELAQLLKVAAGTVQKWAREKQFPCIRIGDTIRIDPGMLADWFELQAACVLVQPEMERGRSLLVSIQPFGRGFLRRLPIRWRFEAAQEGSPRASGSPSKIIGARVCARRLESPRTPEACFMDAIRRGLLLAARSTSRSFDL